MEHIKPLTDQLKSNNLTKTPYARLRTALLVKDDVEARIE
jgi:hypothetical protein